MVFLILGAINIPFVGDTIWAAFVCDCGSSINILNISQVLKDRKFFEVYPVFSIE